jgi:cyclic lactone autoinducer peptide
MKKIMALVSVLLVNVAITSAMTGRSRFIFYEPEMPEKLKQLKEQNEYHS